MSKFKNDTHFRFDGYEFNPEKAWPKISLKPNYFTSFLSYNSRKTKNVDCFVTDSEGNRVRILCLNCNCCLSVEEIQRLQVKCNSCLNLEQNKQNGEVSANARKRLQNAFDWLYLLSQRKKAYNEKLKSWYNFKIAMLTIKLPCADMHDSNYIKSKMLNNFLTQLRTIFKVNMYIWRAERGNDGILHFHIIHDCFLPYQQINKIWNKILDTHGYIAQYRINQQNFHRDGFKFNEKHSQHWDYKQQLAAYKKGVKTNWSSPSGTSDIHSVKSIRNTKAYLSKYIQKPADVEKKVSAKYDQETKGINVEELSEQEQYDLKDAIRKKLTIDGNLWYVSQSLSRLKSILVDVSDTISDFCQDIFIKQPTKFFQSQYCRIFKLSIKEIISKKFTPLIDAIAAHIMEIRKKYYPVNSRIYSTLGIPLQLSF